MDRRTALRSLAAATAIPLASPAEFASLFEARKVLDCSGAEVFMPAALTDRELLLVRTIADIILPRTDTPSATDVGVHEFIDIIVGEWLDPDESQRFRGGLADLDSSATSTHGAGFAECPPSIQIEMVEALDERHAGLHEAEADGANQTFFHWMKRLTLTGYFTSEEGLEAIQHRRIPGAFQGCQVPEPAR